MPNYLNKVVYLTEAQKETLFSTGSVTANGQTITYNANDLYFTTDGALPVSGGGTGANSASVAIQNLMGSTAIGNNSTPIYWNGSSFAAADNITSTDTKNTAGSTNNASKLFLIGATEQSTNPQTYSHSAVYATNGALVATSFNGNGAALTALNMNNAASGTLAIGRGGTGLTSAPSVLVNLASTTAANILTASPRPGVTGILPIAYGGTNANTAANAIKNLIGTTAIGGTAQPIYWNGSAFVNTSYKLNATVSNATANGVAYYNSATGITSTAAGAVNTALMGKGTSTAPEFVFVAPNITITDGTSSAAPQINVTVLGISGTAKSITTANTGVYGVTKLVDAVNNSSTALAATANAVKTAYDLANGKQNALTTSAVGNSSTPVYWNGSTFVETSGLTHYNLNTTVAFNATIHDNASNAPSAVVFNNSENKSIDLGYYITASNSSSVGTITTTTSITSSSLTISLNGTSQGAWNGSSAKSINITPTSIGAAQLASPGFTGIPTAPTAAAGTNTTQIATTAFVQATIDAAINAAINASY